MANTQSLPATWSTIFTSASPRCFGVAVDSVRDLLWTLTDPGTGSRELTAIDVDQGSATFGQVMANTVGVASGIYERWTLSPSGNLAAVLTALPGTLTVVDTRPGSPTFLQSLFSAISVPVDQPGSLTIPNKVLITPDDRYALILIQLPGATPGEIARFDIDNGVWVDHNPVQPGTQNMSPMSSPPVVLGGAPYGFALAADGRFAIASGFNGCGWVGRLTLDPQNTQSFSWTVWSPGIDLGNAWSAGLAADETEVGIATWPSNQCATVASARLVRLDAATGALLGTVPIPFNVNSSTLQNLYTVVYR